MSVSSRQLELYHTSETSLTLGNTYTQYRVKCQTWADDRKEKSFNVFVFITNDIIFEYFENMLLFFSIILQSKMAAFVFICWLFLQNDATVL